METKTIQESFMGIFFTPELKLPSKYPYLVTCRLLLKMDAQMFAQKPRGVTASGAADLCFCLRPRGAHGAEQAAASANLRGVGPLFG